MGSERYGYIKREKKLGSADLEKILPAIPLFVLDTLLTEKSEAENTNNKIIDLSSKFH